MARKEKSKTCCTPGGEDIGRCYVESVVSVDERGQMLIPKTLRDRAGIKTGTKLTLIGWEKNNKICCISMVKTDDFTGMVKELLGPMMKEISVK